MIVGVQSRDIHAHYERDWSHSFRERKISSDVPTLRIIAIDIDFVNIYINII